MELSSHCSIGGGGGGKRLCMHSCTYTRISDTLQLIIAASGGGDPHFSVLLRDGSLLCYSVQGESNSAFNLISSTDFLVNAKFVPDSKREGVT